MITPGEAKKIIRAELVPLIPVERILSQATGMVLATDIFADIDIPAFAQSSMDGYALCFGELETGKPLKIAGEIPAGSNETISFFPGEAIRIFTGAPLPDGADTVVMQEKISLLNNQLIVEDENLKAGANVRPKGGEIKKGELALPEGATLSPAAIGFLAGIGITKVNVYPNPCVGLIITGKELQQPGNPLQLGQVYESNSFTLISALQQLNITNVKLYRADDDLEILKTILQAALIETDMVLLTGGISVGDYDFVLEAANLCGIAKLFHRVKQRPGKPLYFGKKGIKPVFGLPGNPSSVLTCFYQYVLPALQKMGNHTDGGLKTLHVPLAKEYKKAAGLTHFLKGYFDGEKVMVLESQESYRLSSFARANCFIKIEEDISYCPQGENIEIHLFPVC